MPQKILLFLLLQVSFGWNALTFTRRQALITGVGSSATLLAGATPAFAKKNDYKPILRDVDPILSFGKSLSQLKTKLKSSDPNDLQQCVVGLEIFAQDPSFYPTFARNYVLKIGVATGADDDERVKAIIRARDDILAVKSAIDNDGDRTVDASFDIAAAVSLVADAQLRVGDFLTSCGVKDDSIDHFLSSLKQ